MTFVVTEPCFGCKYTDCVVVCPKDCFYEGENMLFIDPNECIDCAACISECPVGAIFHEDEVPEQWRDYIALNAEMCPNARTSWNENAAGRPGLRPALNCSRCWIECHGRALCPPLLLSSEPGHDWPAPFFVAPPHRFKDTGANRPANRQIGRGRGELAISLSQ